MTGGIGNDDAETVLEVEPSFQVDEVVEISADHCGGKGDAVDVVVGIRRDPTRIGHDAALHVGQGDELLFDLPQVHACDSGQFVRIARLSHASSPVKRSTTRALA